MAEKYLGEKDFKDKKKKYNMPNRYGVKDDPFYLKMCKYIWSQYNNSGSTTEYGGYSGGSGKSFSELRLYALGLQGKRRYLELLDDCDEFTNEGYLNLNQEIVQILPKFRDIVKGKMLSMGFEITTQALDELSSKARLNQSNKMRLLTSPMIKEFMEKTGIGPPDVELPQYIKTAEEVDVWIKMGGVRLEWEMAMADALQSTQYESHWETIKEKNIEDIVDLGICAIKTIVHKKTHKVISDYVDPEKLIIQKSKYADHRDSTYAGEVRSVTIGQLRMESDLTEGQLMKIAKKYKGRNGNSNEFSTPSGIEWEKSYRGDYDFNSSDLSYNDFRVDVLECYFIAKDVERYLVGVREDEGNYIYDKVKRNAKLSSRMKKRGKKMDDNIIEKCYRCCWVIGCDEVYDNDVEYAIAKANKDGIKQALLPIQVYSNKSKSLVERCIAFVDDIQLATLKKRNALSKMAPGPRMVVDKSLLRDSVNIGGDVYSMLDLLTLYSKSGVLIVESKSEYEGDEGGSNRPPFSFMPSGVQEDLQIFLTEIATNIDSIRQVTGINEVADGTSQKGDMLVGVMQNLSAATNNALRPHFNLLEGLTKNWARYTTLKWQTALMGGDIDINFIPIGDSVIKSISLSKELYMYDYGVMMTLVPTQEDKQLLMQNLHEMKAQQQIGVDDFFMLWSMVKNGDIKKAQLYLSKATKSHAALMHKRKMEEFEVQGKSNAEAAKVAEQERRLTMQAKMEGDLMKIAAQGEEDRKTIEFQAQFDSKRDEDKDTRKFGSEVMHKSLDKQLESAQGDGQGPELNQGQV